jgi:hypothetical protein
MNEELNSLAQQDQQQQMMYPPMGGGGYPMIDSKADLLDKIRPEETIEEIKQRLMGKEWDKVQERWVQNPALKNIALTEIGASAITNLMFPASTRTVSVSNLKDEEIKKRLLSLVRTAMKMCLDNWQEYGIKSIAQLYFIKEIVYTNTLVALKQPEGEGIRRLLNSTISESRNVSTYGEDRVRLLGLFRPRK